MNEKLLEVIKNLSPVDNEITGNTELKNDLGFDSLKITELMVNIEEVLSFEFNEVDLNPAKLNTVLDLEKLIKNYVEVI